MLISSFHTIRTGQLCRNSVVDEFYLQDIKLMLYRCEGPYDRSIFSSLYLGPLGIGFLWVWDESRPLVSLNVMAPTTDGRRLPRAVREWGTETAPCGSWWNSSVVWVGAVPEKKPQGVYGIFQTPPPQDKNKQLWDPPHCFLQFYFTPNRNAALRRDGLYPLTTPPRSLTPPLCRRAAVERHVTRRKPRPWRNKFTDSGNRIITGPPNGPVLFCLLESVVVCNKYYRAGGRAADTPRQASSVTSR